MKLRLVLLTILCGPLLWGASGPDDRRPTDPRSIVSPSNPSVRPVPIDDLYFTRNVYGHAWSPDGKEVVFITDMSGRANLWKVSASGGWPMQLTQSDDGQWRVTWSPDGKWIVYQQDRVGDEMYDLYAIPSGGGEITNLTKTDEISEESPRWSPDGKTLAIAYKPKASSVFDIALIDWQTRQVRVLTHEEVKNRMWFTVAWSPDGKTLFANRFEVSFTDSNVYSVDVASDKMENLTPHEGKVLYGASSLSPDGKTLLLTSNQKGGYQNVALLDVATKKLTWVTDIKWEAQSGDFSPDGKSFTYGINEDGHTDAFLVNRASGQAETVPMPAGVNSFSGIPTAYSPRGDRLLAHHSSSTRNQEPPSGGTLVKWRPSQFLRISGGLPDVL